MADSLLETLVVKIIADASDYFAGIDEVMKSVEGLQTKFGKMGGSISASVATATEGVEGLRSAVDNLPANKQVNVSVPGVTEVIKNIQQMGEVVQNTAVSVQNATVEINQIGSSASTVRELANIFSKLSLAMQSNSETAKGFDSITESIEATAQALNKVLTASKGELPAALQQLTKVGLTAEDVNFLPFDNIEKHLKSIAGISLGNLIDQLESLQKNLKSNVVQQPVTNVLDRMAEKENSVQQVSMSMARAIEIAVAAVQSLGAAGTLAPLDRVREHMSKAGIEATHLQNEALLAARQAGLISMQPQEKNISPSQQGAALRTPNEILHVAQLKQQPIAPVPPVPPAPPSTSVAQTPINILVHSEAVVAATNALTVLEQKILSAKEFAATNPIKVIVDKITLADNENKRQDVFLTGYVDHIVISSSASENARERQNIRLSGEIDYIISPVAEAIQVAVAPVKLKGVIDTVTMPTASMGKMVEDAQKLATPDLTERLHSLYQFLHDSAPSPTVIDWVKKFGQQLEALGNQGAANAPFWIKKIKQSLVELEATLSGLGKVELPPMYKGQIEKTREGLEYIRGLMASTVEQVAGIGKTTKPVELPSVSIAGIIKSFEIQAPLPVLELKSLIGSIAPITPEVLAMVSPVKLEAVATRATDTNGPAIANTTTASLTNINVSLKDLDKAQTQIADLINQIKLVPPVEVFVQPSGFMVAQQQLKELKESISTIQPVDVKLHWNQASADAAIISVQTTYNQIASIVKQPLIACISAITEAEGFLFANKAIAALVSVIQAVPPILIMPIAKGFPEAAQQIATLVQIIKDVPPVSISTAGTTQTAIRVVPDGLKETQDQVNKLADQLKKDFYLNVVVETTGFDDVKQHIVDLKALIDPLSQTVNIDMQKTQGTLAVEANITGFAQKLDGLRTPVDISITTNLDTLNNAVPAIEAVQQKMANFASMAPAATNAAFDAYAKGLQRIGSFVKAVSNANLGTIVGAIQPLKQFTGEFAAHAQTLSANQDAYNKVTVGLQRIGSFTRAISMIDPGDVVVFQTNADKLVTAVISVINSLNGITVSDTTGPLTTILSRLANFVKVITKIDMVGFDKAISSLTASIKSLVLLLNDISKVLDPDIKKLESVFSKISSFMKTGEKVNPEGFSTEITGLSGGIKLLIDELKKINDDITVAATTRDKATSKVAVVMKALNDIATFMRMAGGVDPAEFKQGITEIVAGTKALIDGLATINTSMEIAAVGTTKATTTVARVMRTLGRIGSFMRTGARVDPAEFSQGITEIVKGVKLLISGLIKIDKDITTSVTTISKTGATTTRLTTSVDRVVKALNTITSFMRTIVKVDPDKLSDAIKAIAGVFTKQLPVLATSMSAGGGVDFTPAEGTIKALARIIAMMRAIGKVPKISFKNLGTELVNLAAELAKVPAVDVDNITKLGKALGSVSSIAKIAAVDTTKLAASGAAIVTFANAFTAVSPKAVASMTAVGRSMSAMSKMGSVGSILPPTINNMRTSMSSIPPVANNIGRSLSGIVPAANAVTRAVGGTSWGFRDLFRSANSANMGITYLKMSMMGSAGFGMNLFSKFDDELTRVLAHLREWPDKISHLNTKTQLQIGVTDLSTRTTTGVTDLAKGLDVLVSSGMSAGLAMRALSYADTFAIAGNMELAEATRHLVDIQNTMGMSTKDVNKHLENTVHISDMFVGMAPIVGSSVKQLTEAFGDRFVMAMKMANMTLEQGIVLQGVYSLRGIRGSDASDRGARAIMELSRRSLENMFRWRALGISVYDAKGGMVNISNIVSQLSNRFAGFSYQQRVATMALLGFENRAIASILPLVDMDNAMKELEEETKKVGGVAGLTAEMLRKDFMGQMKIMWNQISSLAVQIGKALAPIISVAANVVGELVKWLNRLGNESPVLRNMAIYAGLFIVALRPGIGMLAYFGSLIVSGLIMPFQILAGVVSAAMLPFRLFYSVVIYAMTGAASAIRMFFTASVAITRIGILLTGVAGILSFLPGLLIAVVLVPLKMFAAMGIAIYALHAGIMFIASAFTVPFRLIQSFVTGLWNIVSGAWSAISVLRSGFGTLGETLFHVLGRIEAFGEGVIDVITATFRFVSKHASIAAEGIHTAFWYMSEKIVAAFDAIVSGVSYVIKRIAKVFDSLLDTGWEIGKKFGDLLIEGISIAFKVMAKMAEPITSALTKAFLYMSEKIAEAVDVIYYSFKFVFVNSFKSAATFWEGLTTMFSRMGNLIAQMFTNTIETMSNAARSFGNVLLRLGSSVWSQFLTALEAVGAVLLNIVPLLVGLMVASLALIPIISMIVTAVSAVGAGIASVFITAALTIKQAFMALPSIIAKVWESIKSLFASGGLFGRLVDGLPDFVTATGEAWNSFKLFATDAVEYSGRLLMGLAGFFWNFQENSAIIFKWVKENWNLIVDEMGQMFVTFVKNMGHNLLILGELIKNLGAGVWSIFWIYASNYAGVAFILIEQGWNAMLEDMQMALRSFLKAVVENFNVLMPVIKDIIQNTLAKSGAYGPIGKLLAKDMNYGEMLGDAFGKMKGPEFDAPKTPEVFGKAGAYFDFAKAISDREVAKSGVDLSRILGKGLGKLVGPLKGFVPKLEMPKLNLKMPADWAEKMMEGFRHLYAPLKGQGGEVGNIAGKQGPGFQFKQVSLSRFAIGGPAAQTLDFQQLMALKVIDNHLVNLIGAVRGWQPFRIGA